MKTTARLLMLLFALINLGDLYGQSYTQKYSWNNLPKVVAPVFKRDTFNIVQFGAKPDGLTLNTASINKAIETCSSKGGGVVLVPGGVWQTGPLVLQNNVNLHISRNAMLLFTNDFNQYALVKGSYEGNSSMRNQSPISGANLQNIALTGTGIIDGNGDSWRMVTQDALTEHEWKKKIASGGSVSEDGRTWFPSEKTRKGHSLKDPGAIVPGKTEKDYEAVKDFLRPTLLNLTSCKKVLLEGVTFQNSPAWGLHLLMSEDITLRNVFVKNPDYAQNGDGVDVESCRNVLMEGCTFDVGDDGICIKSGKDKPGRERGMPTENVVISKCVVYKGHGGFVIGSEMSGGARNIFVTDCSFVGTDKGLRFKTARGRGGVVEDIYMRNIFMKDIVDEAIYFDMYYFTKPPAPGEKIETPAVTEETPQFRNFEISNVVCIGANKGIFIRGLPEMSVKNITISNAVLSATIGAEVIEAEQITLKQVSLTTAETNPVVYVENSRSILVDDLTYNKNTNLLIKVNGERSKAIRLSNTGTAHAIHKIKTINGARTKSVQFQ